MKSSSKIVAAASALIAAASFIQSADAHEMNVPELLDPVSEHISQPVRDLSQKGTGKLQEKVLAQINQGLIDGTISSADAAEFKRQIDEWSDSESWYKSVNSAIPAYVVEKNTKLLNALGERVQTESQPKLQSYTKAGNSLHNDVDDLIGHALAHDYITSGQAEKYYLRLAQIESIIENSKHNPVLTKQDEIAHQQLKELRTELMHLHPAKISKL
ncbi:MAG TPA: hypothetical protein V6C69_07260 [Trichormus sp.]|jgi:hypothetical protein